MTDETTTLDQINSELAQARSVEEVLLTELKFRVHDVQNGSSAQQ